MYKKNLIFYVLGSMNFVMVGSQNLDSKDQVVNMFCEALQHQSFDTAYKIWESNKFLVHQQNQKHQTLLHHALANYWPEESVKFLLSHGWDVNAEDNQQLRPLDYALKVPNNMQLVVKLLGQENFNFRDHDMKYIEKYCIQLGYPKDFIDKIKEIIKNNEEVKKDNEEVKKGRLYFATLPDPLTNMDHLDRLTSQKQQKSSISLFERYEPNSSILLRKKQESEILGVDWSLDKLEDWQVRNLERAETKRKMLDQMGQMFENGAGI